jgi:hypothetical protein
MGEFSAEWLALREPADHASRSATLARDVIAALPPGARILDLACGTGSNLRYLRGQILIVDAVTPARQQSRSDPEWLLVDHDAGLLKRVSDGPGITTLQHDLRALDDQLFSGCALVTASALLDLVAKPWIARLVLQCRRSGAAVLFALTYDGRISCEPAETEDELVRALVNRHQRTDKGFGPALGPDAAPAAIRAFTQAGYQVSTTPSDWVLDGMPELQQHLIQGWADAATEIEPGERRAIHRWRARRLEHVVRGRSRLQVGHQDLAARLP